MKNTGYLRLIPAVYAGISPLKKNIYFSQFYLRFVLMIFLFHLSLP